MPLRELGKPFAVIGNSFVKVGEIMSPSPIVTAVFRFGQGANGYVGAGIVFLHEQSGIAFVSRIKKHDGEPRGVVFELKSRFYVLCIRLLHELSSFVLGISGVLTDCRTYETVKIGICKPACIRRSGNLS